MYSDAFATEAQKHGRRNAFNFCVSVFSVAIKKIK
jgi:hypothetical protein